MSYHLDQFRAQLWEKNYPGCSKDIEKIFGISTPDIRQVAKWKQEWYDTTPNYINIDNVLDGHVVSRDAGIHPFFYEIWVHHDKELGIHENGHIVFHNRETRISFFFREHLVLFKLNR